jgi:Cysteine rich repeat
MKLFALTALMLLGLSIQPAVAGEHHAAEACKADITKFCPGTTDQKAIDACLDKHEAELSAACKASEHADKKH